MSAESFEMMDAGSCEPTHVQIFSTDLHLFGVQCKQWWLPLLFVLIVIAVIKLSENYIYTKIGQLQRELMQMDVAKRTWTSEKVLALLFWELIANIMGIISVLFITGNNVLIWLTIIIFNCVGVVFAYTRVKADHHSTALELINMLKTYDGVGNEHQNTMKAIGMLRQVLDHHRAHYPLQKPIVLQVLNVQTGSAKTKPPVGSKKNPIQPVPSAPNPDDMLRFRKLHL